MRNIQYDERSSFWLMILNAVRPADLLLYLSTGEVILTEQNLFDQPKRQQRLCPLIFF